MWIIGNEIRHASFDRTNLSRGTEWVNKNYRLTCRKFGGGAVEVIAHKVDPGQQKRFSESRTLGGLVSGAKVEEEKSEVELERKRVEREKDNLLRSVRRAKQGVRWAVKAIGADHLLTLTYRAVDGAPMADFERLGGDWKRFCRLIRAGLPGCGGLRPHKGLKDWPFVAIPEVQDIGSFHLHVAVKGRQDISFIRRCWYVAIGGNQDDVGVDTVGQINVRGPQKRWGKMSNDWKCDKLAGYMTKYLHKTFDQVGLDKGRKRYWTSRSNEKPVVTKIWLEADGFEDAILQSHAYFREVCYSSGVVIWASQGYDCVWLSG